MALQTDLSRNPYFDDYDSGKNFYKILYRPGIAVQARELNQMQSIAQDQIDKFGRFIFKEGSVVEGCSFTFDDQYNYVKILDTYTNGTAFTINDFTDKVLYNNNGLQAIVTNTYSGYESKAPDLNTLYIKYLNTVSYSNGNPQTSFSNAEILQIKTTSNTAVGNVTVATVANSTGVGYAFNTTGGVIFKKGFFINVEPQTIVVSKYNNYPDNISVGIEAVESIVIPEADTSLYDNAAGSPNYSAPGAHRLKLTSTLVTRTTNDTSNTMTFFSLCDFKMGKPVSIKNDPQLAGLGKDLARRTFETNGNYIVYPFILSSETKPSTDAEYNTHLNLISSAGTGYVEGYRVEFINNNRVSLRKGTDYQSLQNQIVSANFGYYVKVNEYSGLFDTSSAITQIELHNTTMTSITSETYGATTYSSSTKIGTAYARGFAYDSGTIGSPSASYRLYLFNISMLSGKKFSDVKSIQAQSAGTMTGVADVIQTYNSTLGANTSTIENYKYGNMIFPIGQKAIKTDGFSNIQFVYKDKHSSTITNTSVSSASHSVTLPAIHGSANESFNQTGTLIGASTLPFLVIPAVTGYSKNKTGTANTVFSSGNATVVTGSSTTFLADYMPGDYISIGGSAAKRIKSISNNTQLTVDVGWAGGTTTNTHAKVFPSGVPIDYSKTNGTINRSITISGNTATLSLGELVSSAFNVTTFYDKLRYNAEEITKSIKKNVYVAINCASHSTTTVGPWSLGFPDVKKINAIYINAGTFANSGANYAKSFKFDSGQKDSHYDLASISGGSNLLTSASRILVDMDVFTNDRSTGAGFFSGNSYPITTGVANSSTITIEEIPQYVSSDGAVFDLRDCIDFRPYATNTASSSANTTNWAAAATVNPPSALAFDVLAAGTFLPTPDTNFQANLQHYLGRKDRAVIRTTGEFSIIEGYPSNKPVAPLEPYGVMTLGVVDVPPYPSLSTPAASLAGRYDYAVTSTITQNKRYTMRDINTLSNRIDNIEYYTALTMLEKSAKDTLVRSSVTGLNRFQNGILVDSFSGHDIGNTLDPSGTYNIAIDSSKTEMRPAFHQYHRPVKYNSASSTGTVQRGNSVFLQYQNVSYINQKFANKYRNCIDGNLYVFKGEINFNPPGSTQPDLTKAPDVVTNLDLASNWVNLAASAFGTQWGNWSTYSAGSSNVTDPTTLTSTTTDAYGNITNKYNTHSVTTTLENQQRAGQQMNVTTSSNKYTLFEGVTDVSILNYVSSIVVKVTATGMKRGSRVYAFMNNIDVTQWFRQTDKSFNNNTIAGYYIKNFGDSIVVDDTGSVYGFFTIPPSTFKATTLEMRLVDVTNLATGSAAITTEAVGTFYGSNLSIAKGKAILSTQEATLSVKEVTDQKTITTTIITDTPSTEYIPGPQPEPSPYDSTWSTGGDGGGCGGSGGGTGCSGS